MELDILCEVPFTDKEAHDIEAAADSLGISQEEVIRSAVKSFAAECVSTQNAAGTAAHDS